MSSTQLRRKDPGRALQAEGGLLSVSDPGPKPEEPVEEVEFQIARIYDDPEETEGVMELFWHGAFETEED